MKIIKLDIKNIGLVEDASITFDKPLLLFYGEIRQGKTTILNAVRWCFGGAFPADIIRHGAAEASVCLTLDRGALTRSWYRGKDGTTKARELQLVLDGAEVRNPAAEVKKLLNPFLLNQNHLVNMTALERDRYFADLFEVSTKDEDASIAADEATASDLRAKIKVFGEIDTTPVQPGNAAAVRRHFDSVRADEAVHKQQVQAQITALVTAHRDACARVAKTNLEINQHNLTIQMTGQEYEQYAFERQKLLARVAELDKLMASNLEWRHTHTVRELEPQPPVPDTASLEAQLAATADTSTLEAELQAAVEQDARYAAYQTRIESARQKAEMEERLKQIVAGLVEKRRLRLQKLVDIANNSGIPGLTFEEGTGFVYQGTASGMLSTSQLMTLSQALASKYPEGFGLDLIDRGESLGKSIFAFVDKAKAENKTILAAIVGERPAVTPPEVGVFVVENGCVKA